MTENIKIQCENSGMSLFVKMGTSLEEVMQMLPGGNEHPFLAAYVNNRSKELTFRIYTPVSVRFIDITHFEGMRVYQRTLFFILHKAVHDLFPQRKLRIKHAAARGVYCELEGEEQVSLPDIEAIQERMRALIEQRIPIVREKLTITEAEQVYQRLDMGDTLTLIHTRPHLYMTVYSLADLAGYFYGTLATTTGEIGLFELSKYYQGFHVAFPRRSDPSRLEDMVPQDKMFDVFNEYTAWMGILGVATMGALNGRILANEGGELIKIAEAFHEKKFGVIADRIHAQHQEGGGRIVLISGPSSSGKTTFAKRLGIQLRILGLRPVLISLDDYFVERDKTPLDEKGNYDYEALESIDMEAFNSHLERLLAGEAVDVPRYDFITGKRVYTDQPLLLDERSVLVIEGIHGLNPKLTSHIEDRVKFKIYVSAFTSVALDNLNRIATTDNRLLRRIIRDSRMRGSNATQTLQRWGSVRRGEEKHIFPYQEQADVMFNSSLFYEIAVLRSLAEGLLYEVPDTVPEYGEARRLLKFLDRFTPLDGSEIPPTSLIREFIGGSSFTY